MNPSSQVASNTLPTIESASVASPTPSPEPTPHGQVLSALLEEIRSLRETQKAQQEALVVLLANRPPEPKPEQIGGVEPANSVDRHTVLDTSARNGVSDARVTESDGSIAADAPSRHSEEHDINLSAAVAEGPGQTVDPDSQDMKVINEFDL
jgi:hypothetical protein